MVSEADESPPCDLLAIIGETPRATTFLGEQRWPVRRLVALKLLKPDACSATAVARALSGAPAHPAIAPLLESGYISGRPYLMTAFLGGGTLTRRYSGAAAPTAARLKALAAVADALVFAHARGIAHGRLVPSNVLCGTPPFAVQIVDFECNGRKAAGAATNALVAEDVDGMLTLADLLLHGTPADGVVAVALGRLRRSAKTATEVREGFEQLQARLTHS